MSENCLIGHSLPRSQLLTCNLVKKGMNIGYLNIQGICSRDMTKFSEIEIELMMTSEENKNLNGSAKIR